MPPRPTRSPTWYGPIRRPVRDASGVSARSSGAAAHTGLSRKLGALSFAVRSARTSAATRGSVASTLASRRSRASPSSWSASSKTAVTRFQSGVKVSQASHSGSELFREPRPRNGPVALHRRGRDPHRFGGLLDRESAEESQLDDARLALVERGEPIERRVERDEIDRALGSGRVEPFVESDARLAAAALQRIARAGALDQDLPHRVRRDRADVRAILPAFGAIFQELQVGLVHERRRLKRLPRTLSLEIVRRQPPQFAVDEGHQRLERGNVPACRPLEELVELRLTGAFPASRAPFRRRAVSGVRGHQAVRSIVTLLMTTGVTGRSCRPVGVAPIFFTTSSPSTTSPKTEWRLSRCGVGPSVMKNWLPLVFGPAFAMDRMPARSCRAFGWNSSPKL